MKSFTALSLTLLIWIVPSPQSASFRVNSLNPVRELVLDEGIRWLANGDGSAWVWNTDEQILQQIDLMTGNFTDTQIPLEFVPLTASVEAGSLWVLSDTRGRLERIDTSTRERVGSVDISPYYAEWEFVRVVTGEGTVWVKGEETMLQIDPQTNQMIGAPVPAGEEILFADVAEGELWVGSHDDGLITRIDLETQQILAQFDIGFSVHGLAVDQNFAWVLDEHGFGVVQVDPATSTIIARMPIDFVASNIAAHDGDVWVAPAARDSGGLLGNDAFVRIDSEAMAVVETVRVGEIQSRDDGYYLALVEDGEAWAVVFDDRMRLVRLSADTGESQAARLNGIQP